MISRLVTTAMQYGLFGMMGIAVVAVLIWYEGPVLQFGEYAPLKSEISRIIAIVIVFVIYSLYKLTRLWLDKKKNKSGTNDLSSFDDSTNDLSASGKDYNDLSAYSENTNDLSSSGESAGYFNMDDEHTVIKPNPRGRAPGPAQAHHRPRRTAEPGKKVDLSGRPALNEIEKSATVLLSLLSQIRNTSSHPNPNGLHKQLATEIQNFEKSAQRAGINEKTVFIARYALCTTIDEFVMTTPWGSGSIWGTQSLLSLFHKETRGGERFFQLVKKLSEDPAKNIDLLELLYLCLALGFQGRYRVMPNGLNELAEIRESLFYAIKNQRQEPEPELSLHWQGLKKSAIEKPVLIPAWLAASIVLLLLVGLFSFWRFSLGNHIDPVHARVMNIGREESLLPTRLLAPQAAVYIPDPGPARFGLRQFLEPEIRSGQVTVEELPDRIVVSIAGDNLFDSGSEIISSNYHDLIKRVSEGLEQTNGRIMVVGHTDNVPMGRNKRFSSNFSLSQSRAESVVKLLSKGVGNPSRLTAEGLGDTRPIASNASAGGRAQNRRVDIILMERTRS